MEVVEDGAGPVVGSDCGNFYCRLPATAPGTPLFLCAHLDTVPPAGELQPVVVDGVVRNAGGTILGADNKAAVAVMLEAVRRVLVEGIPHAGIEIVLTLHEETTLAGARAFDRTWLAAEIGYVFDHAAPIGHIVLGAPHQSGVDLVFHGRSAHAGIDPEAGRSAIVAAANAIARLRVGRLDPLTTANVGVIDGGTALNVVPDRCSVRVDVRSHDAATLSAVLSEVVETAALAADAAGCTLDSRIYETAPGFRFEPGADAIVLAERALRSCGYEPTVGLTGGGADSNVFNQHGLRCVTLSNGMAAIHTPDEHIAVADLDAMVEVTLALVAAARDGA